MLNRQVWYCDPTSLLLRVPRSGRDGSELVISGSYPGVDHEGRGNPLNVSIPWVSRRQGFRGVSGRTP